MINGKERPMISICIPTYEMHGKGHVFLRESLERINNQSYKNFEVVISDFSKNNLIQNLCTEFSSKFKIRYFKNTNPIVGMASNANNAIKQAEGEIVKLLMQDDFFYHNDALSDIVENFDITLDHWMVTACEHSRDGVHSYLPFYPSYNSKIHLGRNTISSPSVLVLRNKDILEFDTNLQIYVDVDFYKRYYDMFGLPKILNKINVVNRTGPHQLSNTLQRSIRENEYEYILQKYHEKTVDHDVTIVAVSGVDPSGAIKALRYSIDQMRFKKVLLISRECPENLDRRITWIRCAPDELSNSDPKNTTEYSRFIAYQLDKYIDTDYALIVHNNAFVLRPEKWDDRFFEYDYIGAPWPPNKHFTPEGVNIRVGNGGFSFRSKRMLHILNELNLPFTDNKTGYFNEDGIICNFYRKILEEHGLKFAPPDIAALFSTESECPETVPDPFGFHDNKTAIPRYFFIKYWFRKLKENIRYILRGT